MQFRGKYALITGAARRIGREIALTVAQRGAGVVIHYDRSRKEALRLRDELQADGTEVYVVQCSFSAAKHPLNLRMKSFLRDVYSKVPRIDILVNNASIFYPTPLARIREKDWDDFMTVNLKAPFFLASEIGKRMMKSKRGKIVNLVDWTGLRPHPKFLPYAVSKAGLIAATAGLARALAPHVQVVSLAPGPILPSKGMTAAGEKAVVEKTLLKRMGDPQDIAQTVRFFIEDTDYITGAFIPVDGGAHLA